MSNTNTKSTARKSKKRDTFLDKLMSSKDSECNIGTVKLKKKTADAVEYFKQKDKKLFELIIAEALEKIDIFSLHEEHKIKSKTGKEDADNFNSHKDINDGSSNGIPDNNSNIID